MDPASRALALSLWIDDLDAIFAEGGDQDEIVPALAAFKEELQNNLRVSEDRHVAVSVARDALQEQNSLKNEVARLMREERQAASDHDLACRMSGKAVDERADIKNQQFTQSCQSFISAVERRDTSQSAMFKEQGKPKRKASEMTDGDEQEQAQNASKNKGKARAIDIPGIECSVCTERIPMSNAVQLACKPEPHTYCQDCVQGLFTRSLTDTALFPPKCCRNEIPLGRTVKFLDQELIQNFHDKKLELATPNPLYCYDAECATFVRPKNVVAGVGTCHRCQKQTCALCKTVQHQGLCPEDEGTKTLKETARQCQWQTCYHCRQMVELTFGCHHITCKCKAEFCYNCAKKWKTCNCAIWTEERLLQRDQMRAQHQLRQRQQQQDQGQRRVAQADRPPPPPAQVPQVPQAPVPQDPQVVEELPAPQLAPVIPAAPVQPRQAQAGPAYGGQRDMPCRAACCNYGYDDYDDNRSVRANYGDDESTDDECYHEGHLDRIRARPGDRIQCSECGDWLRFIMCCEECNFEACWACMMNR